MGTVTDMFNRIASRYDLINRVLSFGMDVAWRRRVARLVAESGARHVLDLATGTGDLLVALADAGVPRLVGVDPAEQMLSIARSKRPEAEWVVGSAEHLPFPDGSFDAVTMGFGIRNAADLDASLREIRRVLKPRGRAFILEFSTPQHPVVRIGWRLHLRTYVPLVGGLLSGDFGAYRYLNRTIESFPSGETFLGRMTLAGFRDVRAHPLCLGAVTIYEAQA